MAKRTREELLAERHRLIRKLDEVERELAGSEVNRGQTYPSWLLPAMTREEWCTHILRVLDDNGAWRRAHEKPAGPKPAKTGLGVTRSESRSISTSASVTVTTGNVSRS